MGGATDITMIMGKAREGGVRHFADVCKHVHIFLYMFQYSSLTDL